MKELGLPAEPIEFQFLYGIRRDLQQELHKEGYPCGCMCLMARTGTLITCGGWQKDPPMSGSLSQVSSGSKRSSIGITHEE